MSETSETSSFFFFSPFSSSFSGLQSVKFTSPCLANKEMLERFGVKLPDRIESASCGS